MEKDQFKKLIEIMNAFMALNKEQQNYIKGIIDGLEHSNAQNKLTIQLN